PKLLWSTCDALLEEMGIHLPISSRTGSDVCLPLSGSHYTAGVLSGREFNNCWFVVVGTDSKRARKIQGEDGLATLKNVARRGPGNAPHVSDGWGAVGHN